jgi:hypothetical protein
MRQVMARRFAADVIAVARRQWLDLPHQFDQLAQLHRFAPPRIGLAHSQFDGTSPTLALAHWLSSIDG